MGRKDTKSPFFTNGTQIKLLMKKIPVTILTGFLGAGKTTFLNKMVRNNKDKKIAIIENEFGETGIDGDLIIGASEGVFELANGCICCTMNDEMLEVLNKILQANFVVDHLIIETTGVADPGKVALSFLVDPEVAQRFEIQSIIALADSRYLEQQLEREPVACRQIALADTVILAKSEFVESYQKDVLKNIISRMTPNAHILEYQLDTIPSEEILGTQRFSGVKASKEEKNTAKKYSGLRPAQVHQEIGSISVTLQKELDFVRFTIFLRLLLNENWMEIYRVKGVLGFQNSNDKVLLQGVNNQYLTEALGEWEKGHDKISRMVFIGRNLSGELIREGMKVCCSRKEFIPEEFYQEIIGLVKEYLA